MNGHQEKRQKDIELNKIHNKKMQKIKAARDKLMATKTEEKGLIIVHTGSGKGKSSSGFGMIMRCIAHNIPCAVVQFIKGTWQTGEREFLEKRFQKECIFIVSGEGFTWETQNRELDISAANSGWEKAKELIRNSDIKFISFFILLLFKEWSPLILTLMFGVVDSIPISSRAKVPELPKFNSVVAFASKDPRPFP